jgi:hypothetical protein
LGTGPIPADMWLDQDGCLHMLPPVPLVPGSTPPSPAGAPAPRPTMAQIAYPAPPSFDALGGGADLSPTHSAPEYIIEPVLILQQLAADPTFVPLVASLENSPEATVDPNVPPLE